jgi:WD40 repeat protein
MSAHAAPVTAVALGPTARHAVSVADDGEVVVWELPGGRLLQRARDEGQRLGGVALSPDGRYALTGADSGTLRLWDVGGLRVVRSFAPPADAVAAPVVSVGFSDDGRRVAGVDAGGTVWIWDLQTGALLNRIATASAAPARAAVGADAGTALVAGADGQLALWEIGSGRALWRSGLGERRATAVALGPRAASGALVASDDKRLLLWGPSP